MGCLDNGIKKFVFFGKEFCSFTDVSVVHRIDVYQELMKNIRTENDLFSHLETMHSKPSSPILLEEQTSQPTLHKGFIFPNHKRTRNFKLPSMSYPIHNDTFNSLSDQLDIRLYNW